METLDIVTKFSSDSLSVDVVYLNFLKAFDMVPHRRLLHKLSGYDFRGDLLSWFRSFLTGRRQRVVLGDTESAWTSVTSGVAQGSVLGPIFFILYINDLPERISNDCKLYADDSKVIAIMRDILSASLLQSDIDALRDWSKDWLLRLNASKCKVMHFGGSAEGHAEYMIDDLKTNTRKTLEKSDCERDLGIYIASDLRWRTHIERAASKANKVLGMLKKTFTSRDADLWKLLYVSLVRPNLEYSSSV